MVYGASHLSIPHTFPTYKPLVKRYDIMYYFCRINVPIGLRLQMAKATTNSTLTAKQQRFVEEYLVDLNATQAAIRAGYSVKTAHSCGPRLLGNAGVAAAIAAAKRERSEATQIDAEWVLKQAVELHRRCMQEVRPALHPKNRRQMTDDDGNALYTFNAAAANRALELIGQHVSINAYRENVQVNAEMSLVERLHAGRARAHLRNRHRKSDPTT